MVSKVFLLTTSSENENEIRKIMQGSYEIYCINKSDLMVELYEKEPIMLIVDLDSFEENAIQTIQYISSIENLSVIYFYKNFENIIEAVKNCIVLKFTDLPLMLVPMLKQASIFNERYRGISESYEAINLLNSEVKMSLNKYLNSKTITHELIDLLYAKNLFLKNIPQIVCIIIPSKEEYKAKVLQLEQNNSYKEKYDLNIGKDDFFKFDVYGENGFSKNYDISELSDINFKKNQLPSKLRQVITPINNFAGFSIDEMTLIAFNYQSYVNNYDVDIIRALTINVDLINKIKYKMNELEEAFDYTTNALARAAEASDDVTGKHVKRVNYFSFAIAEEMGLDNEFIKKIFVSAQMHDVGKIYVDRSILKKPSALTKEEFEQMKLHTIYGEKIIGDSKYLKMSAEIAKNHHEKFDGSGYPCGKSGEDIPLSARIVALADVYDALRSIRPYKKSFTHEEAYNIITKGDKRVMPYHFDPKVLEAFKKINKQFEAIYEQLKDDMTK